MSVTLNTKAYTFDANLSADSARHTGPAHTAMAKDLLDLGRTRAKPTSVYSGNSRVRVKFARTVTLTGALTSTGEAICEILFSIPAGMAEADVDSLRDDAGDFLLTTAGDDLVWKHDITA